MVTGSRKRDTECICKYIRLWNDKKFRSRLNKCFQWLDTTGGDVG